MLEQIERDLKAALLSGDKLKTEILRGIKNAILYETVSLNARESGLSDEQIQKVLVKESKKRAEAIDLYTKVGEPERANKEKYEKEVIDGYLPAQVDEAEIKNVISEELSKLDNPQVSDMGKIIGTVKQKFGASADGATVARLVKEALTK